MIDEEILAKKVSDIEDKKVALIFQSLLGITSLSESEILEKLDKIWEHGFISAQLLSDEIAASKGGKL